MKKISFVFAAFFMCSLSYGQIRVVTSGNTIVGNSSIVPTEQLEVDGNIKLHSPGLAQISGADDDGGFLMSNNVGTPDSRAYFIMYGDHPANRDGEFTVAGTYLRFFSNVQNSSLSGGLNPFGIERMRITNTGRVGIGISNPSATLHVNGAIWNAGGVVSSDRRLKKNIRDFDRGLDDVLALKTYYYNYNGKGGIKNDILQVGIMAQDFEKIAPELVLDYDVEERDIENELINSEQYKAVNSSSIQYLLINAIQEQQAIIEKQNERILKLERAILNSSDDSSFEIQLNDSTNGSDLAKLNDCRPNPSNGYTEIDFTIPVNSSTASIQIHNMNGKLIKLINLEAKGSDTLKVDAYELSDGIYNYSLVIDGNVIDTKKMVLAK